VYGPVPPAALAENATLRGTPPEVGFAVAVTVRAWVWLTVIVAFAEAEWDAPSVAVKVAV
jgi:hypothetical protein